MGAWGTGPFDSDDALDFAELLDGLTPDRRPTAIRRALTAPGESSGKWMYADVGTHAVAAAEIVARQVTGVADEFGPQRPIPPLPDEFRALALAALDRVTAGDSELAMLWNTSGTGQKWRDDLDRLRDVLAPDAESTPPDAGR